MRIADNMTFEQVRSNLTKNRSEMSELQNQAATQKRVTKPSDDPVSAARVLATRVDLQGNTQFLKNLNYAKSFLDFTDQSLSELTENLIRAKELALSQVSDGASNEESRRVVATEIRQIYDQTVAVANRKLGDRFIFGGYKTTLQPFEISGKYNGDEGEMLIHTDKGSFIAMNLPGSKVFLGEGLSSDGISHPTSLQATSVQEFLDQQEAIKREKEMKENGTEMESLPPELRGPASEGIAPQEMQEAGGKNLFTVIRRMETALRTSDKEVIQNSLEELDAAISQVVMARAQIGSRAMALDNVMQTLQKAKVDNQVNISAMEDADVFKTVSDINKTESTLQASLQTSGKLIQNSLLDFLR